MFHINVHKNKLGTTSIGLYKIKIDGNLKHLFSITEVASCSSTIKWGKLAYFELVNKNNECLKFEILNSDEYTTICQVSKNNQSTDYVSLQSSCKMSLKEFEFFVFGQMPEQEEEQMGCFSFKVIS